MTTTEMRIAMARLDGWQDIGIFGGDPIGLPPGFPEDQCPEGADKVLPDYPNDFNAIHRVVNAMSVNERCKFLVFLDQVTAGPDWFPGRIVNSTCAQWCEAILKARGKWKE